MGVGITNDCTIDVPHSSNGQGDVAWSRHGGNLRSEHKCTVPSFLTVIVTITFLVTGGGAKTVIAMYLNQPKVGKGFLTHKIL